MMRSFFFVLLLLFAFSANADQVVDPKLEPGTKPDGHKQEQPQGKTLQDYRSNPVRRE